MYVGEIQYKKKKKHAEMYLFKAKQNICVI